MVSSSLSPPQSSLTTTERVARSATSVTPAVPPPVVSFATQRDPFLTQSAATQKRQLLCNLNDYQVAARQVLPISIYEYISSGTADEETLIRNRTAWRLYYLRPRVLRPVAVVVDTGTHLFGGSSSTMPLFFSPAGVQGVAGADGECSTARVAAQLGVSMGLSQHATRTIEDVAANIAQGNWWFQTYILQNRSVTTDLVRRAIQSGCKAIILTVDSVRFGYREADARNGFSKLPAPHRLVNYDAYESNNDNDPEVMPGQEQQSLLSTYNAGTEDAWDQNSERLFCPQISWNDVDWLKRQLPAGIPLVLKGIMTHEDAALAVEAGADAIMVSNHGGRQLDTCLSSIEALPEVVAAVGGRIPVLLDSGVRRGTDVIKALALGATAVGIGKPIFYALAVGGEEALKNMVEILRTEIEAAMALCGCARISDIQPSHVGRHSPMASRL